MVNYSELSDEELREKIKGREAQGHTGATDPMLDALNREQTRRMSDSDLVSLIQSRAKEHKPFGKLAAAARQRGLRY